MQAPPLSSPLGGRGGGAGGRLGGGLAPAHFHAAHPPNAPPREAKAAACSRTRTTSPTTTVAGATSPAWATCAGSVASVPTTTRSVGSVPSEMTAAGVCGSLPAARSSATISPSRESPIRITNVSRREAACQSTRSPSAQCPVTTATLAATFLCVTGIPADAGAASALETPGTTSQGMPASAHANTSSPPRPKTNGSPPFKRTTKLPRSACSTKSAVICSWLTGRRPFAGFGDFPTSILSA